MALSRWMLLVAVSLSPAAAGADDRTVVAGTVATVGQGFTVTEAGGATTALRLMPGVKITALTRRDAAEIVPGSIICAASVIAPDGPALAMEVQIFRNRVADPAHPPCAALGGSLMVAGVVERVAGEAGHLAIDVATEGGTTPVMVAPETPVVTYTVAGLSLLVKGGPVLAFGTRGADGSLLADRITVGVDGAVPAW